MTYMINRSNMSDHVRNIVKDETGFFSRALEQARYSPPYDSLFLTSQNNLVTLWKFNPGRSEPSFKLIDKDIPIQSFPIVTLNVGFEIFNVTFSACNESVVVSGASSTILAWAMDPMISETPFQKPTANKKKLLLNTSFLQEYHHHPVIDISSRKTYKKLMYRFWNLETLIKNQRGQPSLPKKPLLNFARSLNKPTRGSMILVSGPGCKVVYQIDLAQAVLLPPLDPGENMTIVSVEVNCDTSLVGVLTNKNSLVLFHRELGTRHTIPLSIKPEESNDSPLTVSFSEFETHQVMISYRSGAIEIFDCTQWLKDSDISDTPSPMVSVPSTNPGSDSSLPISPMFTQFDRFQILKSSMDNKITAVDMTSQKPDKHVNVNQVPSSMRLGITGSHLMVGYEQGGLELYNIEVPDRPIWQLFPPTGSRGGPIRTIVFQRVMKENPLLLEAKTNIFTDPTPANPISPPPGFAKPLQNPRKREAQPDPFELFISHNITRPRQ